MYAKYMVKMTVPHVITASNKVNRFWERREVSGPCNRRKIPSGSMVEFSGCIAFSAGCRTASGSVDIRLSELVEVGTLGRHVNAGGELRSLFRCRIFEGKPSGDTLLSGYVALRGTRFPSANPSSILLSTSIAFQDSEICLAAENRTERKRRRTKIKKIRNLLRRVRIV